MKDKTERNENTRAIDALKLAAAPIVGLMFAVFLPFIAIAMVIGVAVKKALTMAGVEAAKTASFNWAPAASYLSGKKKEVKKTEEKAEEKKNTNA